MSSPPLGPQGRALTQCQECFTSETLDKHLQACSGCHRTRYCSRACQEAHWPVHKKTCKKNKEALDQLEAFSKDAPRISGVPPIMQIEARLRQWIIIHRPSMQLALIDALKLQRAPENCVNQHLSIMLTPNFAPGASPSANDVARSFLVDSVRIQSTTDTIETLRERDDPSGEKMASAFENFVVKSKAYRAQGNVGIGIIGTRVKDTPFMHLTPCMMSALDEAALPYNSNWEADLKYKLDHGVLT